MKVASVQLCSVWTVDRTVSWEEHVVLFMGTGAEAQLHTDVSRTRDSFSFHILERQAVFRHNHI